MTYNPKKKAYNIEYTKTHLKRIPLQMQIEQYNEIKEAAERSGESVNGWIKEACNQRLKAEAQKK